ncbi:MAG: histidine kinase [Bacteroidota bacterium]
MAPFFQRNQKWLLHTVFWCVYASFFFYQVSFLGRKIESGWERVVQDFSFHIIAMVFICYLNYFYFLPRFLKHRNIGRYLLSFLPIFMILGYAVILGKRWLLSDYPFAGRFIYSNRFMVNVLVNAFFLVVFVSLLKFVEDWFQLEARKKEFEKEQLTSELRFLKAQINPHFLFNTLNNLYYLAFNNSPNTTEVIAKLSQMMRYMLYESNHPRVPLDNEIEYIRNYISLEKLRLNDEVPIDFEVKGKTAGVAIVPLVLITFLENAFKHGVSNTTEQAWIKATLNVEEGMCYYQVANSKISESGKTVSEKSGIGLQNVKRRLDLSYPDNYHLAVRENEDHYAVDLKLNLI